MRDQGRVPGTALAVFVLSNFAFAQPLFDLLSRNAEFFVAHKSQPVDIILLAAILLVVPPAFLVLVQWIALLINERLSRIVAGINLCSLIALTFLPLLRNVHRLSGTLLLLLTWSAAGAATLMYFRYQILRTYVNWLAPALIVFPLVFFADSSMFRLVVRQTSASISPQTLRNMPPIIIVVFDELSLVGLMDEHQEIDPVRYPNFSALAKEAAWFRNATTVSDSTTYAIPALLTGKYPSGDFLATATDYPNTLFSLLQNAYELKVFEAVTDLCPSFERGCGVEPPSLRQRFLPMLGDVAMIYAHRVLPADFRRKLADISLNLTGFAPAGMFQGNVMVQQALTELRRDRPQQFHRFLDSIQPGEKPALYFIHVLLPHAPYHYLPSGKIYSFDTLVKGLDNDVWVREEQVVLKSYQRFLLQIGYVDTLLGKLRERLGTAGMYERSLLIVTSDHGASFIAGQSRRVLTQVNLGDLAAVPLLIKTPHQKQGEIIDRNVELIDVLPTIADVLDIKIPWQVDGNSVIDPAAPERSKKLIMRTDTHQNFEYGKRAPIESSLRRKLERFGSGEESGRLFAYGPFSGLWGRDTAGLHYVEETRWIAELDQAEWLEHVDLQSSSIPSELTGRIQGACASDSVLAIAMNGSIQAVTSIPCSSGANQSFSAMAPESAFLQGKNRVELFAVTGDVVKPTLRRIRRQELKSFTLNSDNTLTSINGIRIPIQSDAVESYLDRAIVQDSSIEITGWAADVQHSRPAEYITVFANGRHCYTGYPNRDRPDLVKVYGKTALLRSGFHYNLPRILFAESEVQSIRIFAITQNHTASELNYPPGYRW